MGEEMMWDDCHPRSTKERTRHGGIKSQHSGGRDRCISVGLRPAWSTEDRTGRTVTQRTNKAYIHTAAAGVDRMDQRTLKS